MYKATIKKSEIKNGLLSVDVKFDDGTDVFTEKFETNQPQPQDWINQQVAKKIENINSLNTIKDSLPDGEISLPVDITPTKSLERMEFEADLKTFSSFVSAVQQGIADRESPEFVALKNKLKTNFKPEYLDLF